MERKLAGLKVAILIADGFERVEMTEPRKALEAAGATTFIISPARGKVRSWEFGNWGEEFDIDVPLHEANADDYDALLLPGGVINPDRLRIIPHAVEFVKEMNRAGNPIAVICHGPWTLINAEAVKGRTITSWPSLEMDLKNAGANWVDKAVVIDGMLVSSRKPDDIPLFNEAMIELFFRVIKS